MNAKLIATHRGYQPFYLILLFLISIIILTFAQSVLGSTTANSWTICNVNCDFALIQAAINDAQVQDGDTLEVKFNAAHTEVNILVDKSITITGLGEDITVIQAADSVENALNRIFTILDGVDVTIQKMTLQHGNTDNSGSTNTSGGAIWAGNGSLILSHVRVVNNKAGYGGGIASVGSDLSIFDTYIGENQALINNSTWAGGGVWFAGNNLIIKDSRLRNNEGYIGGGLFTQGQNNSLDNVVIFNNKGGGLHHLSSGGMTLNRMNVSANAAYMGESGGGIRIENYSNATTLEAITISNSQIQLNNTLSDGGGIVVNNTAKDVSRIITIDHSIIRNNMSASSSLPNGGGIWVSGAELTMTDSLVSGNVADGNGGGLFVYGGDPSNDPPPTTVRLYNSTISGNSVLGNGGGIASSENTQLATLLLANMTITQNAADTDATEAANGGGIYTPAAFLQTTMMNTILLGNSDGAPGIFSLGGPNCVGDIISAGYNVVGPLSAGGGFPLPPSPCSVAAGDGDQFNVFAANLVLEELLQDNGGSSFTHALVASSVAIDAGNPAGCMQENGDPLDADQRDYGRFGRCDVGAYEYNGIPLQMVYLPLIQK